MSSLAPSPDWTEAIRLEPRNAVHYYDRGWTHIGLRQWDQAIEDFDQAIKLDPNSAWLYQSRAWTNRVAGQTPGVLARSRCRDPNRPEDRAPRLRARRHLHQSRRAGSGHRRFRSGDSRSIPRTPSRCSTWARLTGCRGISERAIAYASQAIRLEPGVASNYVERGVAYSAAKDWNAAIADFDKGRDLNPNHHPALFNIVIAYRDKGDLENSLTICRRSGAAYIPTTPPASSSAIRHGACDGNGPKPSPTWSRCRSSSRMTRRAGSGSSTTWR